MISIIIVNWNGKKWLEKCISSLLSQTYKDFEIIFVDNSSSDDSVEYMKSNFKDDRIKIIENKENSGFAGGNNLGIKNSKGEYILFLNNDTWVENDFLEKFVLEFEKSKLDILGVTEKMYDGGINNNLFPKIDLFGHPIYLKIRNLSDSFIITDLFYTSGVCILFKKEMYDKTGGLDYDFFMYFEEIDWIWRLRLYGLKIGQLNNLFVYHAGAGSTGEGIKYKSFLWRNQNTLQMLLKNYTLHNLLWVLPIYILVNIAEIIAFLLFGKFKIAFSYIEGWIYNIKILPRTLEKRRIIQKNRVVSDKEIMKYMYKGFGKLSHLINYFTKNG